MKTLFLSFLLLTALTACKDGGQGALPLTDSSGRVGTLPDTPLDLPENFEDQVEYFLEIVDSEYRAHHPDPNKPVGSSAQRDFTFDYFEDEDGLLTYRQSIYQCENSGETRHISFNKRLWDLSIGDRNYEFFIFEHYNMTVNQGKFLVLKAAVFSAIAECVNDVVTNYNSSNPPGFGHVFINEKDEYPTRICRNRVYDATIQPGYGVDAPCLYFYEKEYYNALTDNFDMGHLPPVTVN